MTFLLASCSEPPIDVTIAFAPVIGERPVGCDDAHAEIQLTDLRLYVSDVKLIAVNGEVIDVRLVEDKRWQQPGLALLDFENGTGACTNGTREINTVLRGVAKNTDYRGMQFSVGVPFENNHADPLLAAAPLGDAAMHWHWRGGYKFLRAGVKTGDDGFWIHLGSTGCEGTVQNITGCRSPNRISVTIDEFVPGRDSVAIDLDTLLDGVDLEDGVATDCSSGPAEMSCVHPFRAFGLDFTKGTPAGTQQLFRREAMR